MSQGYGPGHGQQGQRGQNPPPFPAPQSPQQHPQWSAPQQAAPPPPWGQPTPAQQSPWDRQPSAAGAYPGSTSYPGPHPGSGDGVNWRRIKLLGTLLYIGMALLMVVRLGIALTTYFGAEDLATQDSGGEMSAVALGTGLVAIVLYLANVVVSLAMLAIGIIVAVMARGRARVGGIVIAAMIPVSIIAYWVVTIIMAFILVALGMDSDLGGVEANGYRLMGVVEALRVLLVILAIGVGISQVSITASKRLSA